MVSLGEAYRRSGQSEDAIAAYQKAVAANSYYWANHTALGNGYFRLGDNAKALPEFQKVIEIASDNPIGYEGLGMVYMREGKWGEAIPQFNKALTIAPDSPTYSNLGTAYFFLKNYDQATKMYEKAVEITPNDEQLQGNLGDSYRWSGHSDQAAAADGKAISLAFQELQVNPRSAAIMGDLGLLYAKRGDAANALQVKVISLDIFRWVGGRSGESGHQGSSASEASPGTGRQPDLAGQRARQQRPTPRQHESRRCRLRQASLEPGVSRHPGRPARPRRSDLRHCGY